MADTATSAGAPVRTERALPFAPALDGLRAIAVIAVLLYHGGVAWMPGGFLGVDLFFCLSGYLITSLLLAELRGKGRIDLKAFWLRRARRLLPAAFVVIAVATAAAAILVPGDLAQTRGDAVASFFYVDNWHQLFVGQSYFAAFERPSLLRHMWSLSIEEQFYVLWPLALGFGIARFGRRQTALAAFGAALLSAALMALLFTSGSDPSRVYYGTDTHAVGLLLGATLAFLWPLGHFASPRRPSALAVLDVTAGVALAAVLLAMVTWHDYDALVYRGGIALFSLTAVVLIAAVVHPAGRAAHLLGIAPLRWIGARSYGIYLWHWPVMALTRPGIDVQWPLPLLLAFQIGLTVALAAVSYRWLEQPFRTGVAQRQIRAVLDARAPRQRLAIVSALTAGGVAAVVAVAAANVGPGTSPPLPERSTAAAALPSAGEQAPAAGAEQPTTAAPPPKGPTLAVGASVMLGAAPELGKQAVVDAEIGRQATDIIGRLQAYRDAGQLPNRVVVQIGENGPVTKSEMAELKRVLKGVDRVVLVNVRVPRSWGDSVNEDLEQAVARWPEARLADWYDASDKRDLLYDDATHPRPEGQKVYARIVRQALRER
ncbi:MAG: acyltransferase family protein [Solirubrobacteraceae bacterium]